MEQRGQQRDNNAGLIPNPPQISQVSSPVKLPLAPIVSTPLTDHRRTSAPNANANATLISNRRGSSIFSPTVQQQQQPPPPQPPNVLNDIVVTDPDPDPDPGPSATTAATPKLATVQISYKECLKNHAASMGGHVVDGCGEFMPGGEAGTLEAMRCAACDCHRNFHRKENNMGESSTHHYYPPNNNYNNATTHRSTPLPALPVPPRDHRKLGSHSFPPHAMVNFGGAAMAPGDSSSEDFNNNGNQTTTSGSKNKRFRSKFSQEQKDRMHDFATKLDWRMQKQDEEEVQRFCEEVGVKRQVFKVWMHNNKQAMKKRLIG